MRKIIASLLLVSILQAPAHAGEEADFNVILREFSSLRHKQADNLARQLGLKIPAGVSNFFAAAETGNWPAVSNSFRVFMVPEGPSGSKVVPEISNELWTPVVDTFGIYETWAFWKEDPVLFRMFYEPALSSMPKGSIYFGGTDPGRFVMTALNETNASPRVFCLTQNGLADTKYTDYLRAVYGGELWMPKRQDSEEAFKRYLAEVQSGKRPKNANIKINENGQIQVTGVSGVMELNGILCEMIIGHNRDKHECFIEESYVIEWMYPYLEPHGLILKINKAPQDKLGEMILKQDRDFWKDYVERLLKYPGFAKNYEAQKTFAKLRSAIAGVYVYRKLYAEAESAFRQALQLCPSSPEPNFRLADMYVKQDRIVDARDVIKKYLAFCPPDQQNKAKSFLNYLEDRIDKGGESAARNAGGNKQK